MQLVGSTFWCEVPDGWQETRQPGCVIAAAPTGELGFTPNVVLRESRIEHRPDTLASISQANLRSVTETSPGTMVIQVEALIRDGAEHRRLWLLTPVAPEGTRGISLCLLTIQELVVVDQVVAELTLTMPFVEWHPGHPYQDILATLRAMPPAERVAPPGSSEVPDVGLDAWATARDGAPREDLSVVQPPPLVLATEPLVFSRHTTEAFVTAVSTRAFPPFTGRARDELMAADLVESDGTFNAAGFWYADHILSGQGWTITAAARFPREFQFWVTDSSTLFIAPHPEQPSNRLMGYCHSNDLFRILLAWSRITPAWRMDVELEISRADLQAKVERDVLPPGPADGDVAEFLRQPWHHMSLTDAEGEPHLNWLHTPQRGDALNWVSSSLRNLRRKVSVRQDPKEPFWFRLTATIAEKE